METALDRGGEGLPTGLTGVVQISDQWYASDWTMHVHNAESVRVANSVRGWVFHPAYLLPADPGDLVRITRKQCQGQEER